MSELPLFSRLDPADAAPLPSEYRVRLSVFEGPLDLLVHLIRKQELPIEDIRIAAITEQYLEYVRALARLDVEAAADFVVMAATLMEIKSETLIPVPEGEAVGSAGSDSATAKPHSELVRQLLAYKAFQDAASLLEQSADTHDKRWGRPLLRPVDAGLAISGEGEGDGLDPELGEMSAWDLLKAFVRILEDTHTAPRVHSVDFVETPIDVVAAQVRQRLETEGPLPLSRLLEGRVGRIEIIGVFLALLELAKQRIVRLEQVANFGDIQVRLRPIDDQGHDRIEAVLSARDLVSDPGAEPLPGATFSALPDELYNAESQTSESQTSELETPRLAVRVSAEYVDDSEVDPDLLDDEIKNIVVPELDLGELEDRPSQPT